MTLKQKIEDNFTLYTLGLLATGFAAGIGAYRGALEIAGPTKVPAEASCTEQRAWESPAREANWIPNSECPAYPVALKVTSPGEGSAIKINEYNPNAFDVPVVVETSRPLPAKSHLGIVFQEHGASNLYVQFLPFSETDSKKGYRTYSTIYLPFKLKPASQFSFWVIAVDDKDRLGDVYASLEQLRSSVPDAFVSEKVTLGVVSGE